MTDLRPGGWDDERLAAAFASRAAATPPTPGDIVDEVTSATARRRGSTFGWPGLAGAAGTLVVLLVVVGSLVLRPTQPVPGTSNVPGSGNPVASGEAISPVLAAIGEPITVSAALAVRDSGADSRELAVTGFLSPLPAIPCPFESTPRNPTRLWCSTAMRWVMEQPEQLWGPSAGGTHRPTGPAFNPSFALVEAPDVPMPQTDDELPVPVVLMGHFDDRRARLCVTNKDTCAGTFVVDRVISVDGEPLGTATWGITEQSPRDDESTVDALIAAAAPASVVVSRQLLPVSAAIDVEPLLNNDELIPFADPSKLAWIVTAVELAEGAPVARTFMLLDGSSWFSEITPAVVRRLEWIAPEATGGPVAPSSQPNAFDSAPTSVLGIPVRDIARLQRERQAVMDELGRDEIALRAWYLGPDPSVTCDDQPRPIHEPRPPCDEARHWLLDDPSQFGIMRGQIRRDPSIDHYPPVLNPLLPIDVGFDVGETWQGSTAQPVPVVVLGHFEDMRVDTYAGNLYFVIDSLAWTPGRAVGSLDTVVRLTPNATEEVSALIARVEEVSPNDAVATWATVVDAADFPLLDRRAESMPEFASGPPVWILRRLIHSEMDGRLRLAVEWAWTADNGSRVWWTETPDSPPDLGTHIRLDEVDAQTTVVRIFDYDQHVTSARAAQGLGQLSWQHAGDPRWSVVDVGRGQAGNEVVVRWTAGSCDSNWDVRVSGTGDGGIKIQPTTSGDYCPEDTVVRPIVIVFDQVVDLDRITSGEECCG
jgi:hypothetical protein